MIDLKDSFKINRSKISRQEKEFNLCWEVPERLSYFDGHFPDNPILPAVAVIDLLNIFFCEVLDREVRIVKIASAKFSDLISPGDVLKVSALYNDTNGLWGVKITNQNEKLVSKVRVQFDYPKHH